jgi:hypothetical protein
MDATKSKIIYSDITGFVGIVQSIVESTQGKIRAANIEKLLSDKDLIVQFTNAETGKQIFKHEYTKVLKHEYETAKKLTDFGFNIVFVPKTMFKKKDKKYDIFALTEKTLTKADLKANFTPTSNAVYNSIVSGNKQAKHIVLDIKSLISTDELIQGLRDGIADSKGIQSIKLFYKKKYYELDRNLIFSKRIYSIFK